jgi:hypothetical protein
VRICNHAFGPGIGLGADVGEGVCGTHVFGDIELVVCVLLFVVLFASRVVVIGGVVRIVVSIFRMSVLCSLLAHKLVEFVLGCGGHGGVRGV